MDVLGYQIFLLMSDFVGAQFAAAMDNAYVNSVTAVATVGTVVMTLWITIYGMRMALGQQGHNMTDFMWRAGKAAVVFAIVAASATENLAIQNLVTTTRDDLVAVITNSGTGYRAQTELGLAGLDLFQFLAGSLSGENAADEGTSLNLVLAMVGQGSPAIVGGVLLLLNELAVRIGIAVGPLMLFGLLFESTKDLFQAWIRLLLGSIVSMAILAVVVGEAALLAGAFTVVLAAAKLADVTGLIFTDLQVSLTSAGFGIMLSALIYTVPQMAARYFGYGQSIGTYNLFAGMRPPGGGSGGGGGGPSYVGNGVLPNGAPSGQPVMNMPGSTPPMPSYNQNPSTGLPIPPATSAAPTIGSRPPPPGAPLYTPAPPGSPGAKS